MTDRSVITENVIRNALPLVHYAWRGLRQRCKQEGIGRYRHHWALREITFNVTPGALAGIVSEHGAGKSALLQILASSLRPDRGCVGPARCVEQI